MARAVASSCHRCGASLIATTRRHSLVTLESATWTSILKSLGLKLRLLISVRVPGDVEMLSHQLRREERIDQGSWCIGCDNNVTSNGTSDITQQEIARAIVIQAYLLRISVKYLKQLLYTLSVLTYAGEARKWR